jgi:Ca-activated chloride channel family protein
MNRTGVFFAAAAALALLALVAGVPRLGAKASTLPVGGSMPTASSDGSLSMTARLSHPFIAPGRQDVFVTVDLRGAEAAGTTRAPVNLALVIDRSGSMSGFKLTQAKLAAHQLISQLRASDRLTIVHYGSDVKALDGLLADAQNKERMNAYVDAIWDDGGTNIGEALTTARDLLTRAQGAFRVNRLILVSDGQPTEGITQFDALTELARGIRAQGVSVSSLGVGDDFNENLMQSLAEVGAGAYGYMQDAAQLGGIFQKDLNAAGTQVARSVQLTFKVPPGARLQQVLGYTQVTTAGQFVTVALPDFSAGQHERVVAQFTLEGAADGDVVEVSALELKYDDRLKDTAVTSVAGLSAMTSGNGDVVAQGRDKEATVFSTRARAAQNAQAAAELVSKGDRGGAEQLLQKNLELFEEAGAVAGAPALEADVVSNRVLLEGARKAQTEDDRKVYKKSVNSKARKDFGLLDSTY